jgi:hypothetical protein
MNKIIIIIYRILIPGKHERLLSFRNFEVVAYSSDRNQSKKEFRALENVTIIKKGWMVITRISKGWMQGFYI